MTGILLTGTYLQSAAAGVRQAARAYINLVNLEGAGAIGVAPSSAIATVRQAIAQLDPDRAWRSWWHSGTGVAPTLVGRAPARKPPPTFRFRDPLAEERLIGINVGGHYLRVVAIEHRRIVERASVAIGTGLRSAIADSNAAHFVRLVSGTGLDVSAAAIGIAWAAPRLAGAIKPESLQTRGAGELARGLGNGTLDIALGNAWNCPVSTWNDGECVAAAELAARGSGSNPLLALKLGTSAAAGWATNDGVCALPFELAKCLPERPPLVSYTHPSTRMRGTVRDAIGADPMVATYQHLSRRGTATWADLRSAFLAGDRHAVATLDCCARGIADSAQLVAATVSDEFDLVLTGRNLDSPFLCDALTQRLERHLLAGGSRVALRPAHVEPDLCAAVGAAMLAGGTPMNPVISSREEP